MAAAGPKQSRGSSGTKGRVLPARGARRCRRTSVSLVGHPPHDRPPARQWKMRPPAPSLAGCVDPSPLEIVLPSHNKILGTGVKRCIALCVPEAMCSWACLVVGSGDVQG